MSYYEELFPNCPYCKKAKPTRLIVESYYYKNEQKQQKRWKFVKEINEDIKSIELPSYIFKTFNILETDDIFLEIKFINKSRVDLSFNKKDEQVYSESQTAMRSLNKGLSLNKLENGISLITKSDIATFVEIKIEK